MGIKVMHTVFPSGHDAVKLVVFDDGTAQLRLQSGTQVVYVALTADDMADIVWMMATHLPLEDRLQLGLATPEEMGYRE